jgi:ADP-ribose pyrophosphatase YjhB (NUDIX family)
MNRPTRYAAHAVCIDSGRLLLRRDEPHSGWWTVPGGGLAWGEHPETAVLRELLEQTGLEGKVEHPLGIDTEVHDGVHSVRIVYSVEASAERSSANHWITAMWVPLPEVHQLTAAALVGRVMGWVWR